MSVRVYNIATKLQLENKTVLAKAKALGIEAARVPSSRLDLVTAQYLEQQLLLDSSLPGVAPRAPQAGIAPSHDGANEGGAPAVVIKTTSREVHSLVERILAGVVPFLLEVYREDGAPPIRARLVTDGASTPSVPKPRPEAMPLAELDERTKDLFRAAYFSARHVSKDDWVNLAEYGSALKRQDPTFQPQDFGEKSLGGLIRRMIDDFEVRADENTPPVYFVRLKTQNIIGRPHSVPLTAPNQTPGPRRTATGKVHNLKLGFGFIAPDDGSENVFFHASEVVGCTIFDLRPGDQVEYESGTNEKGPCAWKVRRLSPGG